MGDHDAVANSQIEGGPAPKDRVERAVAVPSHRGLSRNLDSDARFGPRQMTVPLFCAMVTGRNHRLDLRDIKFRPDPDDPTGACQMAVLRGDLARGPSAIAYKVSGLSALSQCTGTLPRNG